jgi:hypothetical protein
VYTIKGIREYTVAMNTSLNLPLPSNIEHTNQLEVDQSNTRPTVCANVYIILKFWGETAKYKNPDAVAFKTKPMYKRKSNTIAAIE